MCGHVIRPFFVKMAGVQILDYKSTFIGEGVVFDSVHPDKIKISGGGKNNNAYNYSYPLSKSINKSLYIWYSFNRARCLYRSKCFNFKTYNNRQKGGCWSR